MTTATTTSGIARLEGVRKSYGSATALHPIDLTLSHGVIGLLGPNGAGKSTMLRLISTTLPPTAGRIYVGGHEVTGTMAERTAARRCLGYLPQEVVFPRGMTAFAFLDYVAVLKEWRERTERHVEVRRVLGLVHLGDRATKRVKALSGGSVDGSRSPRPSSVPPSSSCSMSRPPALTPSSGRRCAVCSPLTGSAGRCCWRPTRPTTSRRCATG